MPSLKTIVKRNKSNRDLSFGGEWIPYTLVEKFSNLVDENKLEDSDRAWLHIFKFFLDEIDKKSIKERIYCY
jgi:hypothetical protein